MSQSFSQRWQVRKPALQSSNGMVCAQSRRAAEAGAAILAEGGNAIDAAIATSLALGATEPWMSGLGGGGYMVIQTPDAATPLVIDFGMRSPAALDPADYPLTGGVCADLFPWPAVLEDRNVAGPTAVALPGSVAGLSLAHQHFARLAWKTLCQPSIALANEGLNVDWYVQLITSGAARSLNRCARAREIYLDADGYPRSSSWTANHSEQIVLKGLSETLTWLAEEGPESFYRGRIAERLVADLQAAGGCHQLDDFADYHAKMVSASVLPYRGHQIYGTPEMTAGPTLKHAMQWLEQRWQAQSALPDADAYIAWARALRVATQHRLLSMGDDGPERQPTCTSHFNVVDADGLMVSCTQTLLSLFGARFVSPSTGILMNNGILWFDPEPGKANSLGPAKRCLANMCPTLLQHENGRRIALGASGGRKILPSVMQLSSLLLDFNMSLEDAIHHPRLDTSLAEVTIVDEHLPTALITALEQALGPVQVAPRQVYPYHFACPSAVSRQGVLNSGVTEVMSPWADAVCAP